MLVDGTLDVTAESHAEGTTPTLHAIDVATGDERWRFEPAEPLGLYGRLSVAGDALCMGADRVYAVSTDDGTEQWRTDGEVTSDLPVVVVDDAVYVTELEVEDGSKPRFAAFDATDGSELWRYTGPDYVEDAPSWSPASSSGRRATPCACSNHGSLIRGGQSRPREGSRPGQTQYVSRP